MIFPKKGNTTSTAVTDDVRLDGIIRNNRYDVKTITL